MYCKKCGKEIPNDSTYCNHCGTRQIPQKVTVEFNKPNISEDDVRKGILSIFSTVSKSVKWIWKQLYPKYWLIVFGVWVILMLILQFTPLYNDYSYYADLFSVICIVGLTVILLALNIRDFRRWLYKK